MKKFSLPERLTVCDLAEGEAGGGGEKAADVEVEATRGTRSGVDVGHQAGGIEAVLREDADVVGVDGGVGAIKVAGELDDAAGGEGGEGFVIAPLGLAVDVDGEVAAVRALDDEGLGVGVDADDGGVKLVNVGAGGGGGNYVEVEGGSDVAGDLAVGVDLDGLVQVEVEVEADGAGGCDDERRGEGGGDGGGGEDGGLGGNGGRGAGDDVEIAEGRGAERDDDAGVGADGDVVHVEESLEAIEACEVDGGRAAEERDAGAGGGDGVDALDFYGEGGDAGEWGVGADDEGGRGDGLRVGVHRGGGAAADAENGDDTQGEDGEKRVCFRREMGHGSLRFLRCFAFWKNVRGAGHLRRRGANRRGLAPGEGRFRRRQIEAVSGRGRARLRSQRWVRQGPLHLRTRWVVRSCAELEIFLWGCDFFVGWCVAGWGRVLRFWLRQEHALAQNTREGQEHRQRKKQIPAG